MPRFLFTIPGRPIVFGQRRGPFIWVDAYAAFVYQGKLIPEGKFNDAFTEIFRHHREEEPTVKMILDAPPTREELVSDAIATLRQLQPESLKTQMGRPPKNQPQRIDAETPLPAG